MISSSSLSSYLFPLHSDHPNLVGRLKLLTEFGPLYSHHSMKCLCNACKSNILKRRGENNIYESIFKGKLFKINKSGEIKPEEAENENQQDEKSANNSIGGSSSSSSSSASSSISLSPITLLSSLPSLQSPKPPLNNLLVPPDSSAQSEVFELSIFDCRDYLCEVCLVHCSDVWHLLGGRMNTHVLSESCLLSMINRMEEEDILSAYNRRYLPTRQAQQFISGLPPKIKQKAGRRMNKEQVEILLTKCKTKKKSSSDYSTFTSINNKNNNSNNNCKDNTPNKSRYNNSSQTSNVLFTGWNYEWEFEDLRQLLSLWRIQHRANICHEQIKHQENLIGVDNFRFSHIKPLPTLLQETIQNIKPEKYPVSTFSHSPIKPSISSSLSLSSTSHSRSHALYSTSSSSSFNRLRSLLLHRFSHELLSIDSISDSSGLSDNIFLWREESNQPTSNQIWRKY